MDTFKRMLYPTTGEYAEITHTYSAIFPHGITPDPTNSSASSAIRTNNIASLLLAVIINKAETDTHYAFLTQMVVPDEPISPTFEAKQSPDDRLYRTDHFIYVAIGSPTSPFLVITVKCRIGDELLPGG